MKKQFFMMSSMCLLLTACDMSTNTTTPPNADNTGRNVRDRNGQNVTAGEQPENEADRGVTQRIRQAIMDDDSLSTNAKNIKIMTLNGSVTLRGPVNNDREKGEIERKVRAVNGVRNINNQLEVVRNDNARNDGSAARSDTAR